MKAMFDVKVRLNHEWKWRPDGNRLGKFRPRYLVFTEIGSSKMEARNNVMYYLLACNLHGSYHSQDEGGVRAKT